MSPILQASRVNAPRDTFAFEFSYGGLKRAKWIQLLTALQGVYFFACLFLKYPASIVQISITNLQPLEADTFVSSRRSKVLIATSVGLTLHPSDAPDKPPAGWSSKSLLAGAVCKNWMRRFSLYTRELHKGIVVSSVTVVYHDGLACWGFCPAHPIPHSWQAS